MTKRHIGNWFGRDVASGLCRGRLFNNVMGSRVFFQDFKSRHCQSIWPVTQKSYARPRYDLFGIFWHPIFDQLQTHTRVENAALIRNYWIFMPSYSNLAYRYYFNY